MFEKLGNKFSELMYKMSNSLLQISGRAVGYSYIRDLGLIIRHGEKVLLLEDDVDNSEDIQKEISRGNLDILKTIPLTEVSEEDLENFYAGEPLEVNGKVYVSRDSSRFISPGHPKLSVEDKRKKDTLPAPASPAQPPQPQVIHKTVQGFDPESLQKLQEMAKALEKLDNLGDVVRDAVQDSVGSLPVSKETVIINQGPGEEGLPLPEQDIPVILDKGTEPVRSNISGSGNTKESDSGSLQDKLKKLRELQK